MNLVMKLSSINTGDHLAADTSEFMTITIPFYQVDAFTERAFAGNPAAVMPLEKWLDDDILQQIAAENNLSESAFLVGSQGRYALRWFTPTTEVELCGHATLASAHILYSELGEDADILAFETLSGELQVSRRGSQLLLNFPAMFAAPQSEWPPSLIDGLKQQPLALMLDHRGRNYYAFYKTEADIRSLQPDMGLLAQLPYGVVVTAPGDTANFVSRYFAPGLGIPEDPVTGSIHCVLVPYWSEQLGIEECLAHQVSARGGVLHCRLLGQRVEIAGAGVTVIRGSFELNSDREEGASE